MIARTRPWWILPLVVVAIVVGGLVVAGAISLSTVMYAGLFGGMMLMHMGGHGRGHGGHGKGHEASDGSTTHGTHDDDQPGSHGCH